MESTLSLAKTAIEYEVAVFLGYETDPDLRGARESAAIDGIVKSGLRQFYYNPAVPDLDIPAAYEWSFLKPVATFSLASGSQTLPLPDDYGGSDGDVTIASTEGGTWLPIYLVGEGVIRTNYMRYPEMTGQPTCCAERPLKGTAAQRGQRYELVFYPEPDDDYTIQLTYHVLPDALSGSRPYCYGGMAHAETILESCLAIAEQRLDDASLVHSMKFHERLKASVEVDRRHKPERLGYNGDRSDDRYGPWGQRGWRDRITVTFDGVSPS